jgi:hypothetical protein
MRLHNLFSLPHLPTRHTKCKKPLIDYFQPHVMIYVQYINIMRIKILNKVIREGKKKVKIVTNLGTIPHRIVIRIVKKCIITQFIIP